jgi:very-short-patch-repair endonuclease
MGSLPTKTGERVAALAGATSRFPSGNTKEGLERIRKRLLDLTNRNPLLNYRHPKRSCIRVVNVGIDQVFRGLLEENKIPFEAVPGGRKSNAADTSGQIFLQQSLQLTSDSGQGGAPEEALRDQPRQHDVIEDAKRAGWHTSYELPEIPGEVGALCVLQYRDELDRSIRLADSKARTIIEESGANMLYLAFGFLEWYESEDSDEAHLAPLLMVPVRLERTRGPRLGTVEHTGDHLECNPCLAELLSRDFSLEFPSYTEEDDVHTYLGKFESILKAKPRWRLRRFLTLSFLSFTKILMYRDLDPARWPGGWLAQHARVRELFEGTRQTDAEYGQEYAIDAPEMKARVPKLILDADSSQHSALIDAVDGKNLVIEGPPGTGKSQTITNLIAHAISSGKTVLFAAEKLAALEVVRKRLDDAGLGIFCLELHSHKTQKQGLMRDLDERLRARGRFAEPPEIEAKAKLLSEKKERLIQYAQLINSTWTPLGKTIFQVLWACQRSLRELPISSHLLSSIRLPFAAGCSREGLERSEHFISVYVSHLEAITAGRKKVNDHPWAWVAKSSLAFQDEARLCELMRTITASVEEAKRDLGSLAEKWGIQLSPNLASFMEAGRVLQFLKSLDVEVLPTLLSPCRSAGVRKEVSSLLQRIENEAEVRRKGFELSQRLDTGVIKDPAVLQKHADTVSSAGFWERLFGADYRAAKQVFRRISSKKLSRVNMAAEFRELAEYRLRVSNYSEPVKIDSLTSSMTPDDAAKIRAALKELMSCWNRFLVSATARGQSAARFHAVRTELGTCLHVARASVKVAEAIQAFEFPPATAESLVSESFTQRILDLRTQLQLLSEHLLLKQCSEVATSAGVSPEKIWTTGGFDEITDHCAKLAEHQEDLHPWVSYLRLREQSKAQGIAEVTELADSGRIAALDLLRCFRYTFYNSLSCAAFEKHPELSEFAGLTLSELQKQFANLDRELIQLNRHRFAAVIDSRPIPWGNKTGPVGSWSDLALIHHEIEKQKRHIPIRKLVGRAGYALQCLKPCFMMGPLSVAQYLAPGKLTFDLVVMDEASQLKPEDAIGVVARGGQLIVVGDPKQLPPTDFFQRLDIEDSEDIPEDDRAAVEEGESILDVAMSIYQPARRLRWHYRSRHESLIAFSNNEFYQGDLIVFPTPFPKREDLGVRWHGISYPVYENRKNVPEAQAVVDAVINHMHCHADESLGVVTLNLQQRELIEDLLEKAAAEDPQAQAYQEKFGAGLEGFFVKNLENVQGDERDVMFISCTYGPDRRGNQFQRFGPINSENGWRRLNVLFTRAKKRVEVFSSLDPAKIQIQPGMYGGVRALKEYLKYAKTGVIEGATAGSRQPDSDFEVSVAGMLADKGYQVQPQVGVAGFFIDLAVVHPYEPGTFLTGIECDGAAYHSGRSARDRDRLRQEILQNLGWKIYRIWSTDWFTSRENESKRLLAYIESLLAQDPRVSACRAKEAKAAALRHRLVEFREKTIRAAFSDVDPARCLLRDSMIDALVRYRPSSKDEWFRRIPLDLRSGTDSAQVGRFLNDVLGIIRDHL